MGLLEPSLVVVLAKAAEQFGGFGDRLGVDTARVAAQPGGTFPIDEECAAEHAMLAHQILDGADLLLLALFLFLTFLGREGSAGIDGGEEQPRPGRAGCDQKLSAGVNRIAHGSLRYNRRRQMAWCLGRPPRLPRNLVYGIPVRTPETRPRTAAKLDALAHPVAPLPA